MSSRNTPRVSILMTTYNTGPVIRETIDAIMAQTFGDWELIVVDDCSTDDTFRSIEVYRDPRIRLYRNTTNQGISQTRNRAIGLARGEYIAATDHDDLSLPERLARQVAYLDVNPEVVLVATAAKELAEGRLRSYYMGELRPHVLAWRLYTRCSIVHSSICYRRAILVDHGLGYRPQYAYAEDFVLFSELSEVGDIAILPEELVIYRESADNASTLNTQAMNNNGMRFLRQRYGNLLGRQVGETETATLWKLFNARLPAVDMAELRAAGTLYAELLRRFLDARKYAPWECDEVALFAAQDWWRAVTAFCQAEQRFDAKDLYRSVADLTNWVPPRGVVTKTYVKSALGRIGISR